MSSTARFSELLSNMKFLVSVLVSNVKSEERLLASVAADTHVAETFISLHVSILFHTDSDQIRYERLTVKFE
jgi:hypothetical protein